MNIVKKISLGLTGTLRQILIIFLTLLGFSIIGLTLSFPLWYFSVEARGIFNIFILIATLSGLIYLLINRIRSTPQKALFQNLGKKGITLLDFFVALLPFFLFTLNFVIFVYIAPAFVILSLTLNRLSKKRYKLASGFCFLIIFIDFLAIVYNGALAVKISSPWMVPLLIIFFIPSFGYFLYENRQRSQAN